MSSTPMILPEIEEFKAKLGPPQLTAARQEKPTSIVGYTKSVDARKESRCWDKYPGLNEKDKKEEYERLVQADMVQEGRSYICRRGGKGHEKCNTARWQKKSDLYRHLHKFDFPDRWSCPTCTESPVCKSQESHIRAHMNSHHLVVTWKCALCKHSNHDQSLMVKHIRIKHAVETSQKGAGSKRKRVEDEEEEEEEEEEEDLEDLLAAVREAAQNSPPPSPPPSQKARKIEPKQGELDGFAPAEQANFFNHTSFPCHPDQQPSSYGEFAQLKPFSDMASLLQSDIDNQGLHCAQVAYPNIDPTLQQSQEEQEGEVWNDEVSASMDEWFAVHQNDPPSSGFKALSAEERKEIEDLIQGPATFDQDQLDM